MNNESPFQNRMSDSNDQLINAVESAVHSFVGIPRTMIQARAEQFAEEYVSATLGLDDKSFSKQIIKDQFIEMFIDKIKWTI